MCLLKKDYALNTKIMLSIIYIYIYIYYKVIRSEKNQRWTFQKYFTKKFK